MRKFSWGEYQKSILDKLIEKIRFSVISKHIKGPAVLDYGCGYDAKLLRSIEKRISRGVGVDISVNKRFETKKIKLIQSNTDNKIKLPAESFETVISLAVIEHVDNPNAMLSEVFRLLKKGGTFLLTTPARRGKLLLDVLSCLHLISTHEISDHKRYYDSSSLVKDLVKAGFKKEKIEIEYFEAGLNIFGRAIK